MSQTNTPEFTMGNNLLPQVDLVEQTEPTSKKTNKLLVGTAITVALFWLLGKKKNSETPKEVKSESISSKKNKKTTTTKVFNL